MSREIISPEGLRADGRRPAEVRQISCELGQFSRSDGSAVFEMGNTKVIASVYGPVQCPRRSDSLHDRCVVMCEYTVASFATSERKRHQKGDRRTKESSLLIKQTFEAAILTNLYPRSQISIYLQVICDDGGAQAAAINAACLALVNAGIPMKEMVTACSVGFVDSTPLLDLNFMERTGGGPLLQVAMYPHSEKIALLQMENKLPLENLEEVVALGKEGCKKIADVLKQKVHAHSLDLLHSRGYTVS